MSNHILDVFSDIDRSVSLYWRTLAKARDMRDYAENGVEWVAPLRGNGPARIYHVSLEPVHGLDRLHEIRAAIARGSLPNGMLFTPTSEPRDLLSLLADAGFSIDLSGEFMVADLVEYENEGIHSAGGPVSVQTVMPDAEPAWADIVNAHLFGGMILSNEQFGDLARLPYVKFYLARYEREPASTCMTISDGDIATLEMVVTRPEMRRRGIAAATIQAAMDDLRAQGVRSLHLRSEPDAIPFYESLGFRTLGRRIVATVSAPF